jgi:two-component system chemotaxis response regulator CheY
MASDPNARVLVVSAIDQRDILDEAIGKGACDFIVKPFDNDRLLKAFETFGASRSATAT